MTLYHVTTSNFIQKTLNAQLVAGVTASATLNNVTSIQNLPGVMIIDRIDTNGTETPSKVEVISFTGTSGSTVTTLGRGLAGTTDQDHEVGAIVEFGPDIIWAQGIMDALLTVVNADGTIKKASGAEVTTGTEDAKIVTPKSIADAVLTLTTPKIVTSINDANGNEVIKTPATTSAVNEVTITNSATGNAVQIKATGGDDNVELEIGAKGNKQIKQTSAVYQAFQSYTPSAAATATLDLSLGNDHRITMPAGNITIALSNGQVGQKFLVSITQDSGGSRTVTWFSTIKWAGGSAPTLTTTGNKRDTLGFVVTGSGTYDGFVVGQNI